VSVRLDHVARMNLIRSSLEDFLATVDVPGASGRIVTRNWKTVQNHSDTELLCGVYTLISVAEGGYKNYDGGEALDGTQKMLLIGRMRVPATDTGAEADGEAVENAEWSMYDNEVSPWLRALPQALCCLEAKNVVLSGQLGAPYASFVVELEECA
jgi:hypothetical protein